MPLVLRQMCPSQAGKHEKHHRSPGLDVKDAPRIFTSQHGMWLKPAAVLQDKRESQEARLKALREEMEVLQQRQALLQKALSAASAVSG